MTKRNIVRTISKEPGLTQIQAKQIVQKTLDSIVNILVEDAINNILDPARGFRAALGLLAALLGPLAGLSQGAALTVTVGPADADVIGTDQVAIQKAIDRVAAAGGGTVVIRAGTGSAV